LNHSAPLAGQRVAICRCGKSAAAHKFTTYPKSIFIRRYEEIYLRPANCSSDSRMPSGGLVSLEEDSNCKDLQRRVLQYVLDGPAARDTVEGIALWWLRGEETVPYAALREALERLVAKGWLIVRSMARDNEEPKKMYGMNIAAVAAIRSFLAGTDGAPDVAAAGPDAQIPGGDASDSERGRDG
jgi:hypothetical protein